MVIDVSFPGGKRVDAQVDGFRVRTDQPIPQGGEGTAPGPYDLFLASIATCGGIYALGFCQARHLSTEGLALRQHVDLDPLTGVARRIRIEIELPKDFPEKYETAIARAVDQCKVRRTLQAGVGFEVRTVSRQAQAV